MTKPLIPRPEPSTGTNYDSYLAPRSKTPAKDALYLFLIEQGYRFDAVLKHWHTPEADTHQAFGRLEHAGDLTWARLQSPNAPGSDVRPFPFATFTRTEEGWARD